MTTTLTAPAKARPVPQPAGPITLKQTFNNTFTMAYRGLLKIKHNPEQLFDVVIQPIIFTLMFTYIFGGAISGDVHSYLPVIIPGILVQTVIMTSIVTGVQLKEDMEKGVFDRFKSLPIARISALSGALTADMVRYGIASVLTLVMGVIMGFRPDPLGAIMRRRAGDRVLVRDQLDLGVLRRHRQQGLGGAGLFDAGDVPADLRLIGVRAEGDHAGVVAGVHRRQPDLTPGVGVP